LLPASFDIYVEDASELSLSGDTAGLNRIFLFGDTPTGGAFGIGRFIGYLLSFFLGPEGVGTSKIGAIYKGVSHEARVQGKEKLRCQDWWKTPIPEERSDHHG